MNIYLIFAACILVLLGALAFEFEHGQVISAERKADAIVIDNQKQVIKQKEKNQQAQQAQSQAQQDFQQIVLPVQQAIISTQTTTRLTPDEIKVSAMLCRIHNCDGVWVVSKDCNSSIDGDLLPTPDKGTLPQASGDSPRIVPADTRQ